MAGKAVWITGASRGIGREIARRFAQDGSRLLLQYHRSEEQAAALAEELRSMGAEVMLCRGDVADYEQVKNVALAGQKAFGGIDVLVNNAGIAAQRLFTDITPEEWNRMLAVHVNGAYHCIRCVLPEMIRRQRGKIINISSMWGQVGASCEVHYSTAKAALIGLTKALAKEVGPSNIQVNCVAPGVIDTDMLREFDENDRHALCGETPLMRLGTPKDVAETVAFLASAGADFITGQVIGVNGGFVV